ncbi:MAG: signal peptidase I [Oscillospiraceae bacterium]|jgi:signal peptidase I|nr:signal peptidase I [Oscillospiraceae bacterium]
MALSPENAPQGEAPSAPVAAEKFSPRRAILRGLYDLTSVTVSAVVVVLLVFVFGFRMVGVEQRSMHPTLEPDQSLIVTAFAHNIKQHDIVIITKPEEKDPLVKRVIALGGQTIRIDFTAGDVWVDGVLQDEPFIAEKTHRIENLPPLNISSYPDHDVGELRVPEDSVFVMGDNRNDSRDSRDARIGCVRQEYLLGKVLFRIKPWGVWNIYDNLPEKQK